MRKIVACVAVLAIASTAAAQDSSLGFAVTNQGGQTSGIIATGSNPTLYLAPSAQNALLTTAFSVATSYDTGTLQLQGSVTQKGDGCGEEVLSSLGLDIGTTTTTGDGSVTASAFDILNTAAATNANNPPWNGTNGGGALGASPALVTDARAVSVPESSTSLFWDGYGPNAACATSTYNMANLDLGSGTLGSGGQTIMDVFMAVGDLKITRTYDPVATQGSQPENVAFGSGDAAVNGSSVGAASTAADASIVIRKKGDFGVVDPNTGALNTTPDGVVSGLEFTPFAAAVGSVDPLQVFLGDFGVVDPNTGVLTPIPDGIVSGLETTQFLQAVGS